MREELVLHLQREVDSLRARGMSEEEARSTASRLFGNVTAVAEECRESRHGAWLENVGRDLLYGLRGLRRTPSFSAVAILSLALGIGVNAAVFSVMYAFLLKPLDVPRSDRLALLRIERPKALMDGLIGKESYDFSFPGFEYLQRENRSFSGLLATSAASFLLQERDGSRSVPGAWVSGDYFGVLRQRPEIGRLLTSVDDRSGGGQAGLVAVISDNFWTSAFGRNPGVLGRVLRLNNHDVTVVGVLEPQFHGITVGEQPDVFAPLAMEPLLNSPFSSRNCQGCSWLTVVGRLKEGGTLSRAAAVLHGMSKGYFRGTKQGFESESDRFGAVSGTTGFSFLRERFADPLKLLLGLSLLVLATSCANLAALLLARGAARENEFSIRGALGASRSRLIRQILTETSLIGVAGALTGIPLVYGLSHWLAVSLFPDSETFSLSLRPGFALICFVTGVTVAATLAIGLSPALRLTEHSAVAGARIVLAGRRSKFLSRSLLTGQVGLSLLLVTSAVLFSGSLFQLRRVRLGFRPDHLISIGSSWMKSSLSAKQQELTLERILADVRAVPQVESAARVAMLPLAVSARVTSVAVGSNRPVEMFDNAVSRGYFSTAGTRMLAGRDFRDDRNDRDSAVILGQSAAKRLFPKVDAVGQSLREGDLKTGAMRRVIGVVEDSKYLRLRDSQLTIFHPNDHFTATFLIRYKGDLQAVITRFQKDFRRMAPAGVALEPPVSMQHVVDQSLATERLLATLGNFFGGLALLLMAIGLYGTLAYYAARRTREIGVRMALGATQLNVIWTVMKENLLVTAAGVIVGLSAVVATGRYVHSVLYGVATLDPLFLMAACALIGVVASAATIMPAWRAAQIDPMNAIRENN